MVALARSTTHIMVLFIKPHVQWQQQLSIEKLCWQLKVTDIPLVSGDNEGLAWQLPRGGAVSWSTSSGVCEGTAHCSRYVKQKVVLTPVKLTDYWQPLCCRGFTGNAPLVSSTEQTASTSYQVTTYSWLVSSFQTAEVLNHRFVQKPRRVTRAACTMLLINAHVHWTL